MVWILLFWKTNKFSPYLFFNLFFKNILCQLTNLFFCFNALLSLFIKQMMAPLYRPLAAFTFEISLSCFPFYIFKEHFPVWEMVLFKQAKTLKEMRFTFRFKRLKKNYWIHMHQWIDFIQLFKENILLKATRILPLILDRRMAYIFLKEK